MQLTPGQIEHFKTFGFLALRGLVKDDLGWIVPGFEEIFAKLPERHDGLRRTIAGTDSSERLCGLLDHPKILGAATSLLGEDFNYLGGDANYYVGDTSWHSDGWHDCGLYIKMAFYLDAVTRDTGCLRVVPGSHVVGSPWLESIRRIGNPENVFGITGREVPAIALESQPGDLLIFNHNLQHASYGGGSTRRMFTLNLCRRAGSQDEIDDLRGFINSAARFWVEQTHSDTMRRTASPARMRHLQQVIDNEDELPTLARRARETMPEPARG